MATTGEKLVELSTISSGTALEHFLKISGGTGVNAPSIYILDIIGESGIGVGDGSITITASGGTQPYEYSIGSGYQGSNYFNSLSGGTYTISVRDTNGYTDIISGIKIPVAGVVVVGKKGGYGRGWERHKVYVDVDNIKTKDVHTSYKQIKINVTV